MVGFLGVVGLSLVVGVVVGLFVLLVVGFVGLGLGLEGREFEDSLEDVQPIFYGVLLLFTDCGWLGCGLEGGVYEGWMVVG